MKIISKLKFILLIAVLSISVFSTKAQDSTEIRKGYTGNVELILGLPEFGINTTQGYRFNKHCLIGGNTGINFSWAGPVIPFCAVAQFDIPSDLNSSFFINAKGGAIFGVEDTPKPHVGGNFAFGIGVRYKRMSYQLAFNAVLLKYYPPEPNEILSGYGTIQLRIGYNFGKR